MRSNYRDACARFLGRLPECVDVYIPGRLRASRDRISVYDPIRGTWIRVAEYTVPKVTGYRWMAEVRKYQAMGQEELWVYPASTVRAARVRAILLGLLTPMVLGD